MVFAAWDSCSPICSLSSGFFYADSRIAWRMEKCVVIRKGDDYGRRPESKYVRRCKSDEWFCTVCQQGNTLHYWTDFVWHMAGWHFGYDFISDKINIPVKRHEKVCASPAEQDCPYFISKLFKGNENKKKYSHLQHCFPEIPRYCGIIQPPNLSSHPPHIGF